MASYKRIEIDDFLKKFNHAYFSTHQFHLASIKRIQKDDNITRLQFCQSWPSEFTTEFYLLTTQREKLVRTVITVRSSVTFQVRWDTHAVVALELVRCADLWWEGGRNSHHHYRERERAIVLHHSK